ncbi:hypothetical protein ACFSTH_08255 [Paenibacillus yanchengensis]|uniref:DUF4145 domain-containing protein n=1 Tax=Paenibacillus yanchengensis TaxID=2035833 RepID=A0ABW4YKV5_9BACL
MEQPSLDESKSNTESITRTFELISESYQMQMPSLQNVFRSATELMRIATPKIALSQIQFPQPILPNIDWSDFYERFADECKSNAKYGWCLSSKMSFSMYREIARTEDRQEVRDALFAELFENKDSELYIAEKIFIITQSSDNWKGFYEECFQSFENGLYKPIIPALVSSIEHEISINFESNAIGGRLIKVADQSIKEKYGPQGIAYIMGASVISLLENGVFKGDDFTQYRQPLLNRNRVLHGRDDPESWSKVDVYKLMSIISSIKMFSL